jgi:uncharacterized membrane protein (UPF0127 family)
LDPLLKKNAPKLTLLTQRGGVLATNVLLAGDSATRRKGLLGRSEFPSGEALVIAPCNLVHTFFMRFPIDLVFVNRGGEVLKVREHVPPSRLSGCLRAWAVLELPTGMVAVSRVCTGDRLRLHGFKAHPGSL